MEAYIRIVSAFSAALGVLSMALMAAAVVVVCEMIFVRYVLSASTIWQTEFVIYSIVAATFLSSPYVLTLRGHVGVDLLPNASSPRVKYWLDLAAGIASLVFCALLAWSGWVYFEEAFTNNWKTETIWAIPLWIPLLPLPLGIGFLCLQYVAELMRLSLPRPLDENR